ncbi:MAG: putative quinol monooxygenase [Aeoliella sp.]
MIHVIATLSVTPGRRDELLALFAELRPKVLAEDGCVEYGAAVDASTPFTSQGLQEPMREDVVMVVEKWENLAALQAHLTAPHMDEFRKQASDLLTGISLQVLDPAS